jgi:hypothetical protein
VVIFHCSEYDSANVVKNGKNSAGNNRWEGLHVSTVGAGHNSGGYTIERAFLYFDTTAIPANAVITDAKLMLYTGQCQNGSTTIHLVHSTAGNTLSAADYGKIEFQSGGSLLSPIPLSWATINFNPTARTWIAKDGTTKLALIHNNDLSNITPTAANDVLVATAEDTTHEPYLVLTYYLP